MQNNNIEFLKNISGKLNKEKSIKAIVLTFDKYKPFSDHMIHCYMDLWPDNPFIFLIPYQGNEVKVFFEKKYGNKVKMIKSPSGIVDTVFTLIDKLEDDEWLFWCMDDRYPMSLDIPTIKKIHNVVLKSEPKQMSAMLFTSEPYCWSPNNIYLNDYKYKTLDGQVFYRRKWYRMIWNHQYMRVGFVKYWFSHFPRDLKQAKIMDDILLTMDLPDKFRLYMTIDNYGIYGESTSRGGITQNTIESLKKLNIPIPEEFNISDMYKIQGKASKFEKMFYYYTYNLKCFLGLKDKSKY